MPRELLLALLAPALLVAASAWVAQRESLQPVDPARLSDLALVAQLPPPERCWIKDEGLHPTAQELKRRVESHRLADDAWPAALRAADLFHTRTTWLKDAPLELWVRVPLWLERARITLVATKPRLGRIVVDDLRPQGCGRCRNGELERHRHFLLGALPAGTHQVECSVTIERQEEQDVRTLWSGALSFPVTRVDALEECLPPTSGAELDQSIRRGMRVIWSRSDAGPDTEAGLFVALERAVHAELSGVGVSLQIDVEHGGRVVECLEVCADEPWELPRTPDSKTVGRCRIRSLPARDQLADEELADWRLHVRGTWKGLLSAWEARTWWQGEFTVSLDELVRD